MTAGFLELPPELVLNVGWMLTQFLWQAFAIAALMELILRNYRDARPRHNWALCALISMLAVPIATFLSDYYHFDFLPAFGSRNAIVGITPAWSISAFSNWAGWIVLAWLAGIMALTIRLIGGWCVTRRRRRNTSTIPDVLLVRCLAIQQQVGISGSICFRQSAKLTAPVVIGMIRPIVLVPAAAVSALNQQQIEALIVHELAHIRRSDAFINATLVVAETAFFFHPAIWWIGRRIRVERELCCDDVAVGVCGDAAGYAEALLSLQLVKQSRTFALASNGGALMYRIARLVGAPARPKAFSLTAICGVTFASIIAAVVSAQTFPVFSLRVIDRAATLNTVAPSGDDLVRAYEPGKAVPPAFLLRRQGTIQGNVVSEAHVTTGPDGKPMIQFTLTPAARDEFASLSRQNVGRRVAVVVNNSVVASPVIKEPMLGGRGQISGNYTKAEASALASAMTRRTAGVP